MTKTTTLLKSPSNWREDPEVQKELKEYFPEVDCGLKPVGDICLFQFKMPKTKTKGGILLADGDKDSEKWNTQVAIVRELGPLAYKDAKTLEAWPEGNWCNVGDYVYVPIYGGLKTEVEVPGRPEKALFIMLRANDVRAIVTGNPLTTAAYI